MIDSHPEPELIRLDHGQHDAADGTGSEERERLRLLGIRKKQELKLVKKFDKSKINVSKECWFLIDSDWLNKWSTFVNGDESEDCPDALSTIDLLDGQLSPRPNLNPIRDYRGVPPVVYYIFLELYGKDSSPEICRYQIDIYKPPVTVAKLVNIQLTGRAQAKIEVNRVRPKWVKWERDYDDESEEQPLGWCCGLTKEHLEAFIYWAITCWSNRRRSGRGDISYRQYQPLKPGAEVLREGEGEEGADAALGAEEEGQSADQEWLSSRRAAEANASGGSPAVAPAKAPRKVKKGGLSATRKSVSRQTDPVSAAAAAELARSQYFLKTTQQDESGSSSSDDEDRHILDAGPADRGVEQGTWWNRFNR